MPAAISLDVACSKDWTHCALHVQHHYTPCLGGEVPLCLPLFTIRDKKSNVLFSETECSMTDIMGMAQRSLYLVCVSVNKLVTNRLQGAWLEQGVVVACSNERAVFP